MTQDTANSNKPLYKGFETIALVISLICLIIVWSLEYTRGRFVWVKTNIIFGGEFTFIFYTLLLVILYVFPYVLGTAVLIRGILIHRKRFKPLLACMGLALLIFVTPLAFTYVMAAEPAFLVGYADQARSQINVPVLQNWAIRMINQAPKDEISNVVETPMGLGSFPYRIADISPNANESQMYVRLLDGGHPIGYYGLVIGGKSFRCTDIQMDQDLVIQYVEIAPGVCAWSGPDE